MFLLRRLASDHPRTFNFEALVCIVKSVLFKSSLLVICVWLNPLAFSLRYWESLRSSCRDVSSTCISKLLEACNKLNFSYTSWFNCYIVGVVDRFLGLLAPLSCICILVKIVWIDDWSYLTWFLKMSVCERESREVALSFPLYALCLPEAPSCFTTLFFDFLLRSTVCNNWFESMFWICNISWFSESWLTESNEWFSIWWCEPALENFASFSADLEGSSFSIRSPFVAISVISGSTISSFFGLRVWSSLLEGFGLSRISPCWSWVGFVCPGSGGASYVPGVSAISSASIGTWPGRNCVLCKLGSG